jgi:hypothetical protein
VVHLGAMSGCSGGSGRVPTQRTCKALDGCGRVHKDYTFAKLSVM